jgi:tRNA(Ile)-lysidine synthase
MSTLDRVRRTIRRHGLAGAETRVVVALSGGSDSVALASLLHALDAAGELVVAGAAHFNHQLRAAADADERFCRDIADRFGWPLYAGRGDVAARAARERRSIEHAARASRYEFFDDARRHFHADVVALGHTRDDQAETFLLRLVRGAGARGLAAMHPRREWIVRPLIDCRRDELRAYLGERGLPFIEDESNADVTIPRNRVRAELLPLLAARFNPNVVDALAAEAEIAREEWAWMSAEAAGLSARARRQTPAAQGCVALDVDVLSAASAALRRVAVWEAMSEIAGARTISFEHVETALGLVRGEQPGHFDAPGLRVEREGRWLVLTGRPPGTKGRWRPASRTAANLFEYPLSIPGEVVLTEAGCVVSAEVPDQPDVSGSRAILGNLDVAAVRRDLCGGPLLVRNRRPGDRFRPDGSAHVRKLQDYFVDRKIARTRRDRIPIVVDAGGRIVWVAGCAIDRAFRVTDPSQGVLILRLRQLGGSA